MSLNKTLALTMFRSMLRWAKAYGEVPVVLNPADIKAVSPAAVGRNSNGVYVPENLGVKALARQAFVACKDFEGDARELALDRGLKAVQLLHHDYTGRAMRTVDMQLSHADRNNVHYCVGQVFQHRKFGYKGVIYGWDRSCQREPSWNVRMEVDPNQPFYSVLPDEQDCLRLFGGLRVTKYVAQENIQLVKSANGITHRATSSYFSRFNCHLDRYVPNAQLAFEYPNDFGTEEDVGMTEEEGRNADTSTEADSAVPPQAASESDAQAFEKG